MNDDLSPDGVPTPTHIHSPNPRVAVVDGEVFLCPFGYEVFGRNGLGEVLAVHSDGGDMVVMTRVGRTRDGGAS